MTSVARRLARNPSRAAKDYRAKQAAQIDPDTGLPRVRKARKQTYRSIPKRLRA